MSKFHQYNEKTGKFIRHRRWIRGRKAYSHISQTFNDFNRQTFQAFNNLAGRLSVAEQFTRATRDMVEQFIKMALAGTGQTTPPGNKPVDINSKKGKKH